MNYMELISRSFHSAWRYRFLWPFGFFVAVADEYVQAAFKEDKRGEWVKGFEAITGIDLDPSVIAMLVTVILMIWALFWFASVLSEGALIHGIFRKEQKLSTGFRDGLTAGVQHFLRLFGIMVVATISVFVALIVLAIIVAPGYFMSAALGVVLTVLAIPVFFCFILVTKCVAGWAIRFAVIQNAPWTDAMVLGWRLFKNQMGTSVAVAFSSLVSQAVLFATAVFVGVILCIPFVILGVADKTTIIPALTIVGALIVLVGAFIGTFASTIWTLGFMRLTQTAPR